jgi:putative tryptophan/tyrosine transport system substrate-binding protein
VKRTEHNKIGSLLSIVLFSFFVSGGLSACITPRPETKTDAPRQSDTEIRKQSVSPEESGEKPRILLINSDGNVEKYKIAQEEFEKTISASVLEADLGNEKQLESTIKKMLTYNADLVYCIGAKAFSFAKDHFGDKYIVFSSIINCYRLAPFPQKTYGISNELHTRMPLFMFRSIFPDIRKIGILYSEQYTLQWFKDAESQAKELEIEIVGNAVAEKKELLPALENLLSRTDALWLISDPVIIPEKKILYEILKVCDKYRKPVFSYHETYVNYGAVMVVSVDEATIGRQAAGIAMELLSGNMMNPDEKVQFPAGSQISLNLKKTEEYGLEYNKDGLGMVNNIVK